MIIGNNNNFSKNPFLNNKQNNNNNNSINSINTLTEDISQFKYTNPKDKNAMCDKSLAMLKDRYEKKLITLDEFKRQSDKIRKFREKNY